jgi:hypothetical protein
VLLAVLLIAILDHSQGPIECVRHDMRGRATQAQTERVIRAGVRLPRRSEGRSASRGTDDSRSDGPRVEEFDNHSCVRRGLDARARKPYDCSPKRRPVRREIRCEDLTTSTPSDVADIPGI